MATSPSLRADACEFVPSGTPVLSPQGGPPGVPLSLVEALAPEPERMPKVVDAASQAAMVYSGSSLSDVVDTLVSSGHSAAVFVGDDGAVKGVLTENDILKAYTEEIHWEHEADVWLESGQARLPGFLLPMLTVEEDTPLPDAAAKMAAQRLTHYACHHLLVEGGALGRHHILSALDIMVSLCNGDLAAEFVGGKDAVVSDVMKPRSVVPQCKGSDCIKAAFDFLRGSEQNCALVVDGEGGFVYGVITPRDALRAYGEHIPEGTAIAGWLRGVGASLEPRRIDANVSVVEAAQVMVSGSLHHLCVVEPGTCNVVGVLSCLDIVCRIGDRRLNAAPAPTPGTVHPIGKAADPSTREFHEDVHPSFQ